MYPGKGLATQPNQVLVFDDSTGKFRYTSALGPIDNSTGFPIGTFNADLFTLATASSGFGFISSGSGVPSTTIGNMSMYLRTDGSADTAVYFQIRCGSSISQSINDYTPLRTTARWGDPVRAFANSNTSTSGLYTLDGVSLSSTNRVLLTNQTTTSQCGIFTTFIGSTWIRAKDANSASTRVLGSKVGSGSVNYVSEGTIGAGRYFFVANSDPIDGNGLGDIVEIGGSGVTLRYSEWITTRTFENVATKQPVRTASRTNVSLSGLGVVGGVQLLTGDRVLVAGQTLADTNGIYVAAAGSWTRSTDANLSSKLYGMGVCVSEGFNAGATFYLTNTSITLGSTSLTYVQLGTFTTSVTPITTNYTVLSTDSTIAVGAIGAPITITLPATPKIGDFLYLKDVTGVAATHNITISGNGNTIDGSATSDITTNFGARVLEYTGSEWSLVN